MKQEEVKKLLSELNISLAQLPKITAEDKAIPAGCIAGEVIKIERKSDDKIVNYYRVVV